jgi:glycosyltransferase involved in cell wall biosynthesis
VSVIIPVYNAERYLAASLDSALMQDFSDIEIICINDGSTDSSAKVLNEYAGRYPQISIQQFKYNRGASAARNAGIENASGKYVFFLDADDSIPPSAIKNLYTAASQSTTDLAIGQLEWFKDGMLKPRSQRAPASSQAIASTSARESRYLQSVPGCHCCNLYRRQFLLEQEIKYATDLTFGEDQLFQATAMVKAASIAIIDETVYFYHHYRCDSLTQKRPELKNLLDDIEYQRRMTLAFIEAGMEEAGRRLLTRWSYPIQEYWLKIPGSFSQDDANKVFSAFRDVIEEFNVTPWNENIPAHHRHVLELLIAGKDKQAFEFLNTDQARFGF